jgi:hypothetical protein
MSNLPELLAQKALKLSRRTGTLAAFFNLSSILGVAMPTAPAAAADDQEIAARWRPRHSCPPCIR